jgi:aspartate racemase
VSVQAAGARPPDGEVIGILGGMGPAATADFYTKLVQLTRAPTDQDHPRVVIWADPTVPDRSLAIEGLGPDPTPWLLHGARVLRDAGATLVAVPCNTAHLFVAPIAADVGLQVVHMIEETGTYLGQHLPSVNRVGVLATTGTVRAGLYQDWLRRGGIDVLVPDEAVQADVVMPAIRAVKAGRDGPAVNDALALAASRLLEAGADAVIAGCTEIPIGLPPHASPGRLIDPTAVLARAVLLRLGRAVDDLLESPAAL